jgi:plasmid maintenance system antidote protein VapI
MSMLVNANAKTMAKIMDLTERRINQLVAEKVINKDEDGQFNVMQVIVE